MRSVTLADGRSALLVEVREVEYLVIEKAERPPASLTHTYTTTVAGRREEWTSTEEWPGTPAGTWAYRARKAKEGYVTSPWFPVAGGHGRTMEQVVRELTGGAPGNT